MLKYLIVKKNHHKVKKNLFLLFQNTKVKKSKQDTIKKRKADISLDLKKWNKLTNVEEFQLLQM